MKYEIDFDEWFTGLELEDYATFLDEIPENDKSSLLWALYTGRNDLIVRAKKRIMHLVKDRYLELAHDEDPSVVVWEDL